MIRIDEKEVNRRRSKTIAEMRVELVGNSCGLMNDNANDKEQ
jgi:hypothetical protein